MSQKYARELLAKLREGDVEYIVTLRKLRKVLRDKDLKLAQIGTSENEIEVIKRLGQHLKDQQREDERRTIAGSIAFLRERSTNCLHAVEGVMSSLDEHHLSPTDVDSSPEELDALMKLAALFEATSQFSIVRRWKDEKFRPHAIRAIGELTMLLAEYDLSAEDIGSSVEEIADLTKAIFEADACQYLESLREKHVNFDHCLSRMHKSLKKADLTLDDIGTSEEHIETLRSAHNLEQVKHALEQLRQFGSNHYVDDLRRKLTEYKLTLVDVDSSEEEVTSLNKAYHQKEATRLLESYRAHPENGWLPSKMLEHLDKGGLTPEEIGSTPDELDSLRSKIAA